ncbi:hypothetical protein [Methanococcoides sp. NM1]|uniref:hypothetical protein n=1 Tax=Methanococcoides sp. NM1 TaxID=1201013 RepID=UPI0010838712|nr:hypothetical protein [Methanococcoides sp. NM1]
MKHIALIPAIAILVAALHKETFANDMCVGLSHMDSNNSGFIEIIFPNFTGSSINLTIKGSLHRFPTKKVEMNMLIIRIA